MRALPIIQRELLARSRQLGLFWSRLVVGLVGVLVCIPPMMISGTSVGGMVSGESILAGLVVSAFLLCSFGWVVTADALSAERREGTLGLLLLTRVKTLDVVLGKLVSNGLLAFTSLLVLVPLLMIPVLAGGVLAGEVARKGIALLNALFVALAVGLFASAPESDRIRSAVRAGSILLLLTLGSMLFYQLRAEIPWPFRMAGLASPLCTLLLAGDAAYLAEPASFWVSLVLVQVIGWVFIGRCPARMRKVPPEAAARPARRGGGVLGHGEVPVLPGRSGDRSRPVAWLFYRQRGLQGAIWTAVGLGLLWNVGYSSLFLVWGPVGIGYFVQSVLSLAIAGISGGLLAWVASRFFVQARASGELELLLTTPEGARHIVTEQWNGLKRVLVLPVLMMVMPYAMMLLMRSQRAMQDYQLYMACLGGFGSLNIVLGVAATCWVGMWFGLTARGQGTAILRTVALVKLLPYCIGWLTTVLLVPLTGPVFSLAGIDVRYLLGQFLTVLAHLWMINYARRALHRQLSSADPARLAREFEPVAA